MEGYERQGPNDLSLPKRIMKYIRDYAVMQNEGQGVIGISCPAIWEMSDEKFKETFGIEFEEKIAPISL